MKETVRLGLDGDNLGESWLSVALLEAVPGTYLVVGFRKDGGDEHIDYAEVADGERASAIAAEWRDSHVEVAVWQRIE